jgi:triacylglycerol lipase
VKPVKKPLPSNLPLDVQQKLLFQPQTNPTGYVPLQGADVFAFEPDATSHSRVNAWWLAEAAWLAYWHDSGAAERVWRERAGMSCRLVTNHGAEAYLMASSRFAIVSFRGTQPEDWSDLFDDALYLTKPWDTGHVHAGFARRLDALDGEIRPFLDDLPGGCLVWFTGHSLGAAVATLAAYRYRTRAGGVYTFGSPLVGNGLFSATVSATFSERSYRYVNDHDIVTRVPSPPFAKPNGLYTHVDDGRWISSDGHVGTEQPSLARLVRDVFGRPKAILDVIDLHKLDLANVQALGRHPTLPDGLGDHTPFFYVLHCWNDFAEHAEE